MESLLESGLLIVLISGLIAAEALILVRRYRITGKGAPPSQYIFNLAAGGTLMWAVQLALWDAPTGLLLAFLSLAGIFHLNEIKVYWRGD